MRTYLQLDDTSFAYLNDPQQGKNLVYRTVRKIVAEGDLVLL